VAASEAPFSVAVVIAVECSSASSPCCRPHPCQTEIADHLAHIADASNEGRRPTVVVRISSVLRTSITMLLAAVLVAGCGGGDESASGADPEQYAADVCGAISAWQRELQTSASTMSSKLSAASTPAQVKTELVAFMEGATKSTDDMLAKVKEAGPPAVEDGEALQRDLEQGLGDAQEAFAEARDRARELPTDDRAAFQRDAQALGTTLNEQGTKIGQTFNGLSEKYDSEDLNQAFEDEPACQAL
jgi:hypothetical protein